MVAHPELHLFVFLLQIMLDDIPLLSQLIELIFYVLIVLNYYTKVFLLVSLESSMNICQIFTLYHDAKACLLLSRNINI